ncbi:MAG: histidine phosphatase family protein, partial [Conexivisphaerales archaeon]
RHGESETNVSGHFPDDYLKSPHLTEKGKRQAEEAADMISKINIDIIFSSPMPRAVETSQILSEKTGVKITIDQLLKEVELGNLKGKRTSEIFTSDPDWFNEYFVEGNRYGIEKYDKIQERMIHSLQNARDAGYKSAVFVSHLEPIRSLVAAAMGIGGQAVRKVKIYNASITIFKYEYSIELYAVNVRPLRDYI